MITRVLIYVNLCDKTAHRVWGYGLEEVQPSAFNDQVCCSGALN